MSTQPFFITLPSNASMGVFPDNTLTHYRVKLPQPMVLTGSWEVALMEIHYPFSWYNITRGRNKILCDASTDMDDHRFIVVKPGYYHNIESILEAIRENGLPDNITMDYNSISNKVTIDVKGGGAIFPFNGMAEILGFPLDPIYTKKEGPYQADVRTFYSLYVYCDLVEDQVVGDIHAPLLRIVNVEGSYGDNIKQAYNKPYFLPLRKQEFDTIEIYIRDDTGQKVPFERGKVIVTLAFRRRRPSVL